MGVDLIQPRRLCYNCYRGIARAMVPETRTSLQALAIELTTEEVRSYG